jgi:hypothetical protein
VTGLLAWCFLAAAGPVTGVDAASTDAIGAEKYPLHAGIDFEGLPAVHELVLGTHFETSDLPAPETLLFGVLPGGDGDQRWALEALRQPAPAWKLHPAPVASGSWEQLLKIWITTLVCGPLLLRVLAVLPLSPPRN